MPQQFVSDDQVIINIQGLRYVSKKDTHYSKNENYYHLNWNFKGASGEHIYGNIAARDAMFDKLVAAITERDKPK